ncbi:hypothetical protein BKA61DRAFT_659822 [Leptodontidium sp. MPI-SDFR-AT-0119]|nr:hypothetical protein BKA61DRAFT_659822 [Leptodontidium sp. MPI-SDFR-AT-0119]
MPALPKYPPSILYLLYSTTQYIRYINYHYRDPESGEPTSPKASGKPGKVASGTSGTSTEYSTRPVGRVRRYERRFSSGSRHPLYGNGSEVEKGDGDGDGDGDVFFLPSFKSNGNAVEVICRDGMGWRQGMETLIYGLLLWRDDLWDTMSLPKQPSGTDGDVNIFQRDKTDDEIGGTTRSHTMQISTQLPTNGTPTPVSKYSPLAAFPPDAWKAAQVLKFPIGYERTVCFVRLVSHV